MAKGADRIANQETLSTMAWRCMRPEAYSSLWKGKQPSRLCARRLRIIIASAPSFTSSAALSLGNQARVRSFCSRQYRRFMCDEHKEDDTFA